MEEQNDHGCQPCAAIVEDETALIQIYEKAFARRGIQVCFVAEDGLEAVEKFNRCHVRPCVVLMDNRLPQMNGIEATKEMLKVEPGTSPELVVKSITGGFLAQTPDIHHLDRAQTQVKTRRAPTEEEWRAMLFGWKICKHVKSNAIVYAREGQTVSVGAGQMSRVDSVKIGAMKAVLPLAGTVVASDAFFPFPDGVEEAAKHGVTAVIQPGGSIRDNEVIEAADRLGLAMVFTGVRHFRH
jgi:phosphoribosylaminoimidazolecarboxamide formyltransferase/IMP cyclohydrolase